jgi:hypothetical protein
MQYSSGFGTVESGRTFRRDIRHSCSEKEVNAHAKYLYLVTALHGVASQETEIFVPGHRAARIGEPGHRNICTWSPRCTERRARTPKYLYLVTALHGVASQETEIFVPGHRAARSGEPGHRNICTWSPRCTEWRARTPKYLYLVTALHGVASQETEIFVPGHRAARSGEPGHRKLWQCWYCGGKGAVEGRAFKFSSIASCRLFQYLERRFTYFVLFVVCHRHVTMNSAVLTEIV